MRVRVGDSTAVRSYSLSSAPGAESYRISVKRHPRGLVSTYLHDDLHPGAVLEAAAPRGEFVLEEGDDGPVVLVSAGIGITPVLAMLHSLSARGSQRPVWWLHSSRRPAEQPFIAETEELLAALPQAHSYISYSAADARDHSSTAIGRLSAQRVADLDLPDDATAFVCGPTAFMADMASALHSAGLDSSHIHSETFGILEPIAPGIIDQTRRSPHPPAGPPGTGPLVTFTRSGISVPFEAGRTSLLEFAESCDVPTRWQCRSGVCRTCETPLLSGEIDYSPTPLEAPTSGTVLLCCARPRTEVVVDM